MECDLLSIIMPINICFIFYPFINFVLVKLLVPNFVFVASCNSDVERRYTASPSVIIVGGGFAGIAAARALHDASFQVSERDI